jgi:hypothetical protein
MLLAVDLGLKTAWSLWNSEGHLCRFESRHFSTRSKLRTGVPTILRSLSPIDIVVAEGDARLAKVWFGFNKEWETELVQAQLWRRDILHCREQRSGSAAKERAIELAGEIIRSDRCGRPDRLNHDTAEAILLGYWAVLGRGWRMDYP